MFSVPPETAAGAAAPPDALVVGLMVPLQAVTANPTVQRVATAVSRLVLRDIEYSFGWSLLVRGIGVMPTDNPREQRSRKRVNPNVSLRGKWTCMTDAACGSVLPTGSSA